jgi:hypothetical protein
MFQFAAGRALASKLNLEHRIDISGFERYQLHKYQLSPVFVGMEKATPLDLHNLIGWRSNTIAKRLVAKPQLSWVRGRNFVVEPHLTYWPGIECLYKPSYLVGYWQSEKYFRAIESTIRTDFFFAQPLSQRNQQILNEITNSQAVSLHIRRGDYVQDSKKLAFHGVCSLDYYREAIAFLSQRIKTPKFFIFSDDMTWVKNNLQIKFESCYVDHNTGLESYNDLRLMSQCKHNIIANSSFSWWGAWLNANSSKIVVAPKKWYANQSDLNGVCPASWVKL